MQHNTQPTLFPMEEARALLARRKQRRSNTPLETRLCAVIATLPKTVKVKDIAAAYNMAPSTLSGLRAQAFQGKLAMPAAFSKALKTSFIPKG